MIRCQLALMKTQHASAGLHPPDEDMARAKCLRAGVEAPDLATVKDFVRFYIATSRPQIDRKPTVDSINTVVEWFFAGFTRVTGTPTDEGERSEVYNWVRRTLTADGLVVNKRRLKHNFTDRDLTRLLVTLWTQDDLTFIPERYRVQFTFIIHVYCWTGARVGAFFTGGLRYKDVDIVLQRVKGGRWRLIYEIKQRWIKNNRDPENIVFGAAGREREQLLYNDAAFLLAMAVADGALFGFKSLEDLQSQEIPSGENELILRYNESALERPILRKCTKAGGITDEPMPRDSFTDILRNTLRNAGYFCGTSVHAIRRQLGKKVDERYTAVQRSQHLTQADTRVFGQSYVANCSSVDGQAAFRGEQSDHGHINYFQSLEKFHEDGLPCKLPAQMEKDLEQDPQLVELKNHVQRLAEVANDELALKDARRRLLNARGRLRSHKLRQHQEQWVRNRRDWKILTRGKEGSKDPSKTDLVRNICLLIPERGRLAQKMALDKPLASKDMWLATLDLYTLCAQDFTVLYLPKLRPADGSCPVICCRLRLESLPKGQRHTHIQACVRRELASKLSRLRSDIHYCHHCFDWVIGDDWETHCREHLQNLSSKRCGSTVYCHTLVQPAYCLFCLGNDTLSACKRMESWTREHQLWKHVNIHLDKCEWPTRCPHPLCDDALWPSESAFQFHLIDTHCMSRTCPRPGGDQDCDFAGQKADLKRKRESSSKDGGSPVTIFTFQEPTSSLEHVAKRSRKPTPLTSSIIMPIIQADRICELPTNSFDPKIAFFDEPTTVLHHSGADCRPVEDSDPPTFIADEYDALDTSACMSFIGCEDDFQVDDPDYSRSDIRSSEQMSTMDDEALFEQYIRSPSPMPAVVGSERGSDTVVVRPVMTMPAGLEGANSFMQKNVTPSRPRIRLHVNPRKGATQPSSLPSGVKRSRKKPKELTTVKVVKETTRKEGLKVDKPFQAKRDLELGKSASSSPCEITQTKLRIILRVTGGKKR